MVYEKFVEAINDKKLVNLSFDSYEKGIISRKCVPFDYGPSRRNLKINPDRYHFYDLNSPDGKHNLSIVPEQVMSLEVTEESFEPSEYVTWEPNWFLDRDWGVYS